MKNNKVSYAALLLFSTGLGALGQVFFKIGVVGTGIALVGYVALGLLFYGISTLSYFYVLSRSHLSWTYGFGGLAYIFASLIAFAFLGEQVSILRWSGIAVIAIGTALIGIS